MAYDAKTDVLLSLFFSSVTSFFYFHLGESILLLALIYYLLRWVLYCLPQLWLVHKWILWTLFRSELYLFSFLWVYFPKFVSKHTVSSMSMAILWGLIYHDNVWYLCCNTDVCGYCRDTTFDIVTRQVGMNDPACLFT